MIWYFLQRFCANELAFIFNDHFHNPCELHPHFYFSDCVRICYKKSCQVWLCTKIRTKALIYCCSSLAINTFFPNNRCLLVVFTTALLLPSAVINLIPILYPKQLRAIADTKYYLHPSKVILLQYYYWRWHKVAVIKQLPPHIRLQSSTISHPFLFYNKLHIQGEGGSTQLWLCPSFMIATQFKSHILF